MFKNIKRIIAFGLIFGLFFAAGAEITNLLQHAGSTGDYKSGKTSQKHQDGERTNILLLGVDARPGEKESRSDTMLMVTIDPKLNRAAVISIPRDTKVTIKGGGNKICHANLSGGPEFAVKVVEDLMNTDIDYYAKIDFEGFEKIVDTLGGVTVDVPPGIKKLSEGINVPAGKQQRLNGHDALGFVRFRDYPMADIQRTQQQQVFLKALAVEILKPQTITKLPKIITQLNQYIDTNMGLKDMFKMASWAPGFTVDSIATQTLPGGFYDERDEYGNLTQSYWQVSQKELTNLIDNMLKGKVVAVVQNTPQPARTPLKALAEGAKVKGKISQKSDVKNSDNKKTDKKNDVIDSNSDTVAAYEDKPLETDTEPPASPGTGQAISSNPDTGPEGYI